GVRQGDRGHPRKRRGRGGNVMNAAASSPDTERDALKRAAAEAAAQLVENDMVVGLGSGSTAAFAVEALARRQRQGLRFIGIPTSERTVGLSAFSNGTCLINGRLAGGSSSFSLTSFLRAFMGQSPTSIRKRDDIPREGGSG